jgi:hypothetical protein
MGSEPKAHYLTLELPEPYKSQAREISRLGYELFHGAPTLVVIYARSGGHHVNVADSWPGRTSCWRLVTPAWARVRLASRDRSSAYRRSWRRCMWQPALPLVVGHPATATAAPGRRPALILSWRHP